MPVVINEFEIVAEAPPPPSPTPGPSDQQSTSGPTPLDLTAVLRHEVERLTRVLAY